MGQNRGNAIEVSAEKYEYRLISAKPDLLNQDAPTRACESSLRPGAPLGAPPCKGPQDNDEDRHPYVVGRFERIDSGEGQAPKQEVGHNQRQHHPNEEDGTAVLLQDGLGMGRPLKRTPQLSEVRIWEERERATPREVQRDFSTRSDGRINQRTS